MGTGILTTLLHALEVPHKVFTVFSVDDQNYI